MSNTRSPNGKLLIFTGGHHTSGLVTALAARRRGWRVVWLGHKHSMAKDKNFSAEYQEVTAAKIPFVDLKTGKIFGTGNFLSIFKVLSGLLQSLVLLRRFKSESPSHQIGVVSFGGYLAVPVVLAAWLQGIPSLTHEQTLVGGGANRLISFFVKKIALTWSDSLPYFPAGKSVVTGLPLRPELTQITRQPSLGPPLTILVMGGKQGSHTLNTFIFNHLDQLLDKFNLVHQTGGNSIHNDFHRGQELKAHLPKTRASRYKVQDYLSAADMAHLFSTVDVIISRSGAHTIYELGFLGIPSVLIPIPWSSRNEQLENAKLLASAGLAVILSQPDLNYSSLIQSIDKVLSQKFTPLSLSKNGTENLLNLIDQTFTTHET